MSGLTRARAGVTFDRAVEAVGQVIDAAGVGVIILGAIAATVTAVAQARDHTPGVYRSYRQQLGRSILLGLELLVAADIIRTVAVTPTLTSIAVLAGIVIIRTFLSFSLELEITGRWPWQKSDPAAAYEAGRNTAVGGATATQPAGPRPANPA